MTTADLVQSALELLIALVPGPRLPVEELELSGTDRLSSAFDADTVAIASAAASNLSAGITSIDRGRVMTSMTGHVELDGAPIPKWADLSGYYETADKPGGFPATPLQLPPSRSGGHRRPRV